MLRKLLLAALACCALSGNAIIWHYGNYNSKKKTCAVTSWSGSQPTSGKLTVPDSYTHTDGVTYTVNTIASHALDNLTEVTEIVIPASIANIGGAINETYINLNGPADNFFNCPKLQKFTVKEGNEMFASSGGGVLYYRNFAGLLKVPQNVSLSSGSFKVSEKATHVAPDAFAENTTATKVRVPGNCTFGNNAGFNRAVNLAEFEIIGEPSLCKLVNGALIEVVMDRLVSVPPASNITSLTLPTDISEIAPEACYNCVNLKKFSAPGLKDMSPRVFMGSGVETLDFPATVATFPQQAVAGAKSLTTLNFRAKDIRLMPGFARDCTALETVTTLYDFDEIENAAFMNCRGLKNFPFNPATEFSGDSIFFNCGLEKVAFEAEPYYGTWNGTYMFCNNPYLTEIDLSLITGTDKDSYRMPAPFAKNCMKLQTLRLPPYTSFVHYEQPEGSSGVVAAFENMQLMHIEIGCFWIKEGDYKFIYSPFNGTTDIRPRVYVATTRCTDSSNRTYQKWPLKYMCTGNNGAVVTPTFYCDAYKPADDYVAARGVYYVPGGCLSNYSEASSAGREVNEMFGLSIKKDGSQMKIVSTPHEGVTEMRISINGADPVTLPGYVNFYPKLSYNEIRNIQLTYKMNGVEMSTSYDSSHWFDTGLADIASDPDAPAAVFDIEGRRVLDTDSPEALATLTPGLYIVRKGTSTRKIRI
ncbi:MAG: leucine-rich repeat domain-containing protein [Muribaculaceae bacterium]|nr:leucine-rich repeat domain-containing protein [Muribaculaceae bacterium]